MKNSIDPPNEPVSGFPIKFQWRTGDWFDIFQEHIAVIQRDVQRALAGGRLVVYLSCPISSYGGSFYSTNVEIANFTAQRLLNTWGTRFWFLNPSQYQMESEAGLGLIRDDAREIMLKQPGRKIDVDALMKDTPAQGGDYMRMWTRVLVEDDAQDKYFLGARFSAFYFLGPSDVREFFISGGYQNLSYAIDDYFARKSGTDYAFRQYFYPPFQGTKGTVLTGGDEKKEWERRRENFFQFYSAKASAAYSKGSHDEWNIWCILNERRRTKLGLGFQIPGYFGGQAIDPAAAEKAITPGYAVP